MPKYLMHVNYLAEGTKGLLAEGGTTRREVARKLFKSAGGKLESFYYAFGDTDVYLIADMPDHVSMAALALTINASGVVAVKKTTVLLTPEDIDAAAKKSPKYRPPGK
jgi:uncharacterized protein with GYD domain